jgi:hypothetical protein
MNTNKSVDNNKKTESQGTKACNSPLMSHISRLEVTDMKSQALYIL